MGKIINGKPIPRHDTEQPDCPGWQEEFPFLPTRNLIIDIGPRNLTIDISPRNFVEAEDEDHEEEDEGDSTRDVRDWRGTDRYGRRTPQ